MSTGYSIQADTLYTPTAALTTAVQVDLNDNYRTKNAVVGGRIDMLSPNDRLNYLINGDFRYIQRWPTALTTNTQTTPGNRYLMHDQWALVSQAASCQVSRLDTIASVQTGTTARYYAQLKQVTGVGKVMYCQFLEAKDTAGLRGRTIRLQFKYNQTVWTSASALRIGMIQNNSSATADTIATTFVSAFGAASTDPTLGTNLAYVTPLTGGFDNTTTTGAAGPNALQVAAPTTTWQRASGLFTVPTNCVNIGFAIWTDGQMAVNDILQLAEASVIVGQEINDYYPMSEEKELARVQRFYFKTFLIDTAPVQNAAIGTGEWSFVESIAAATANVSGRFVFPTRMRLAAPVVTFLNPAAANAFVRDVTHTADCTVTTAVNNTDTGVSLTCTPTAAGTVGGDLRVHLTAEAGL